MELSRAQLKTEETKNLKELKLETLQCSGVAVMEVLQVVVMMGLLPFQFFLCSVESSLALHQSLVLKVH